MSDLILSSLITAELDCLNVTIEFAHPIISVLSIR